MPTPIRCAAPIAVHAEKFPCFFTLYCRLPSAHIGSHESESPVDWTYRFFSGGYVRLRGRLAARWNDVQAYLGDDLIIEDGDRYEAGRLHVWQRH